MTEMMEKLAGFNTRFNEDPKILKLLEELDTRYKELFNEAFSPEDVVSDEFDQMVNDCYETAKESDPDEVNIFEVLWFNL
jgi:hypothetical protein